MKEDVKNCINIFKFIYNHKGTVGTIMVASSIWYEFGLSSMLLFLGIIFMIVGGLVALVTAANS